MKQRQRSIRPWRGAVAGLLLAACASESPPGTNDAPAAANTPDATHAPGTTSGGATNGVTRIDPPAGEGALAPNFAAPNFAAPALAGADDAITLTWLEPEDGGHRLQMAKLEGETWTTPRSIATGDSFFANWADLPMAAGAADGTAFAHWLAKLGEGTYAYGVQMARSRDGGTTWEALGLLHDDTSPTEHGFVSYAALPDGGIQAFWLDGRDMLKGGGMNLRTTRLGGDGPPSSTLLDARVCECCSTDAALTATGPVVVYRDRDLTEIRDIAVIRATADGWSEPVLIHDDVWRIHGCPVNGPAIAAEGDRVAVAWFTAAEGQSKVQVAHSKDGGATFGEPFVVDDGQPLGRVDVVIAGHGEAVVSWLGSAESGAEIRWRAMSPDGEAGAVGVVATTTANRASGVPRMVRRGDELLFVWVETGEPSRLRAGRVPLL